MRQRLGASTGAEAAEKLLANTTGSIWWCWQAKRGDHLLAEEDTVHAPCGLVDLRQMIGLIDAAAVAIAFSSRVASMSIPLPSWRTLHVNASLPQNEPIPSC